LDLAISKLRPWAEDEDDWSSTEKAKYLRNFAHLSYQRYLRHERLENLGEAVEGPKASLKKAPIGDIQVPVIKSMLCGALAARYSNSKQESDISMAIQYGKKAVTEAPDHIEANYVCRNMAVTSRLKWLHSLVDTDNETLKAVIEYSHAYLEKTPSDHPYRARILALHGTMLMFRFGACYTTPDTKDLLEPLEHFKKAAVQSNAWPSIESQPRKTLSTFSCDSRTGVRQKGWD
jgi:hypothetical protein